MASINVDTIKLRECGKDIMSLTAELNELLISMYGAIEKAPWSGNAASEFKRRLNIERAYNIALKDNIYNYGKLLYNAADKIEASVNKMK